MYRWILKHLGVLGALNLAEFHMIHRIKHLGLTPDQIDEIAFIIMDELRHVRR